MKLHSATIKNFKNIKFLEFTSKGNNVTISGENGCGKTATLEAIMTLLFGKKVLPDDPVMHGEESSMLQCEISDGEVVRYKIKVRIGKTFSINVYAFTPGGNEMDIKKPVDFLSQLVTRDFIDPNEFSMKKGVDRIKLLYDLLPGLREKIDELSKHYENEQLNRSKINIDRKRVEGELINTKYTEGLPIEEKDAAELMNKLEAARVHNEKEDELKKELTHITENIEYSVEQITAASEEIKALQKQISVKMSRIEQLKEQINESEVIRDNISDKLSSFKPEDIESIKEEISKLSETNKAIRSNARYKELENQLQELSLSYSEGLERMKKIDQDKIDLFKNAEMPVKGLGVCDDDITFPDPVSGEIVKFGSLSTGQKCMVAIPILAKFLPKKEEGIRAMVINDANALDDKNYEAMVKSAISNDVQLILHRTVGQSESNEVSITIDGDGE